MNGEAEMEKTVARADTLAELRRLLGAKGCLEGADLPQRNRTDWSFLPATDPIAVLRPTSTDDPSGATSNPAISPGVSESLTASGASKRISEADRRAIE